MSKYLEVSEQRDIEQFGLATFGFDAHNRFDGIADQAILQLQNDNEKTGIDYQEWQNMKAEEPQKWKEMVENGERNNFHFEGMVDSLMLDVVYRDEEMIALMEMKIIYAWKHLEIHIKKLIRAAYSDVDTTDFYRWKSVMVFLRSKGILPEDLAGYAEVVQLLQVNNKAKHTELPYTQLQSIEEFKNRTAYSVEAFEKFYFRIKDAPNKFLMSLSSAVYRDLYNFNQERIDGFAKSLALRMEPQIARKFRDSFDSLYNFQSGVE